MKILMFVEASILFRSWEREAQNHALRDDTYGLKWEEEKPLTEWKPLQPSVLIPLILLLAVNILRLWKATYCDLLLAALLARLVLPTTLFYTHSCEQVSWSGYHLCWCLQHGERAIRWLEGGALWHNHHVVLNPLQRPFQEAQPF